MIKQLFAYPVPLYVLCIVIAVCAGLVGAGVYYANSHIYNYQLTVPLGSFAPAPLTYGAWSALSHPEFFQSTKQTMRDQKANFIEANLSTMQLTLYKEGEPTKTVPILSKGKPGSWWETPAGIYKIETKEKSHFSTFGHVYQPWSMLFQGNFFIHGWPTYPDGTEVPAGYSGGCIRLKTEDAKEVYDMASVGMPILVFTDDFEKDAFAYKQKEPAVSASAYMVVDIKNNTILTQKNSEEIRPIASITKLVTALVAAESINMDKQVRVPESAIVPTSKPRLKAGQNIQAFQLLYPLLQESSNEAAAVLAAQLPGNVFVDSMNKKSKAIGLESTQFTDASGASAGNVASAQDLFRLLKYIYINRSFILHLSAGHITKSIYGAPLFEDIQNFNGFVGDTRFIGGKVGETQAAGQTMASVFEVPIAGVTRPIAVMVLDSTNNIADTAALVDYVQTVY